MKEGKNAVENAYNEGLTVKIQSNNQCSTLRRVHFQLKYSIFRVSHFWLYCYGLQQITAYQVLAYSPSLAPLKPSLVLVLTVRGSQAKLLMWAQSAALREATHVTWCLSWFPFNACNWQTEYRAYYSSSGCAVSAFFPRRHATGLPPLIYSLFCSR